MKFSRLFCRDQDQDFIFFCLRGASRPRPLSRGLHHWLIVELVPQSDNSICFFGKTYRSATIHALQTDDRQTDRQTQHKRDR